MEISKRAFRSSRRVVFNFKSEVPISATLDNSGIRMQPVDGRKADHPDEQRDLQLQQSAIIRTDQVDRSADQKPGIDHPAYKECSNSNDAKIGKSTGDIAGDHCPQWFIGASQQSEQQDKRDETAKPSAGCTEMKNIRSDVNIPRPSGGRRTVPRPGERHNKNNSY